MTMTELVGIGLIAVASLVALMVLASLILGERLLGRDTRPDQVVELPRSDGGRLWADRWLPEGARRGVVVTCHGIGSNRHHFDLLPEVSFVQALRAAGYEVWNVDLRGHGRGRAILEEPWSFDDHVEVDVPAILAAACATSGAEAVHWVGHSMGGLVALVHAALHPDDTRMASLCTLGAPVDSAPGLSLRWSMRLFGPIARRLAHIPVHWPTRAVALAAVPHPLRTDRIALDQFSPRGLRAMAWRVVEPVSTRAVLQLATIWEPGGLRSADGQVSYRPLLQKLAVPLCVVAAKGDSLARLDELAPILDMTGSAAPHFEGIAVDRGASSDLCHASLLAGEHAPTEVFPRVCAWLHQRTQMA